jgi:hypothetical protein
VTDDTRGAIIDLALLGVAVVAVYVVVTRPPLRRSSWRLLKYALLTALPTYVWQETTRAWAESANRNQHENRNRNEEPEPGTWKLEPGTAEPGTAGKLR